jgi:hypothetical protein
MGLCSSKENFPIAEVVNGKDVQAVMVPVLPKTSYEEYRKKRTIDDVKLDKYCQERFKYLKTKIDKNFKNDVINEVNIGIKNGDGAFCFYQYFSVKSDFYGTKYFEEFDTYISNLLVNINDTYFKPFGFKFMMKHYIYVDFSRIKLLIKVVDDEIIINQ